MCNKQINVTQPSLPPIEDYLVLLKEIWKNKHLSNEGKFHQELEISLAKYLCVEYISLVSNGTLALMIALKALNLKGEVITTPYSFVATANALGWVDISPVFVDVEPIYGNLDPEKIEAAITSKTTAILPVHVYGNPCNRKKIKFIANK